jgi:hypothetical protein
MLKEILVRNFDSTNPDPERDRQGCRKRGMVDAIFDSPHEWGALEGLPRFVIFKVDLAEADLATYEGFRMPWRDNFDYTITATNPAQGRYSVKIFEVNDGASGGNAISGAKATRIQGYLTRWGCASIVVGDNAIDFTVALWDAVRSVEFWDASAAQLAQVSFTLNSYSSQTGLADITVAHSEAWQLVAARKIVERRGTVVSSGSTSTRFTIERANLLQAFRQDVKRKAEALYMYQRFRIGTTLMDAAEAAGGVLEVTKAQLLAALADAMNG